MSRIGGTSCMAPLRLAVRVGKGRHSTSTVSWHQRPDFPPALLRASACPASVLTAFWVCDGHSELTKIAFLPLGRFDSRGECDLAMVLAGHSIDRRCQLGTCACLAVDSGIFRDGTCLPRQRRPLWQTALLLDGAAVSRCRHLCGARPSSRCAGASGRLAGHRGVRDPVLFRSGTRPRKIQELKVGADSAHFALQLSGLRAALTFVGRPRIPPGCEKMASSRVIRLFPRIKMTLQGGREVTLDPRN